MKAQYFNGISRKKLVLSAFLLAALSVLSSCFHNNESAVAFAIELSYFLHKPVYVAIRDGDGQWVEVEVDANGNTINIRDPDGRYTFLAYGNYRGEKRGYYVESTVADAKSHKLKFDDTSDTVNYTINGEADNFSSGSFYVGTNYRSFQNRTSISSLSGVTPFTANFTQDADEPSMGDAILKLENNFGGHTKFTVGLDYNSGTVPSYAAASQDANIPFDVEYSAISGSSGFSGLGYKVSGMNLKAQYYENAGAGNTMFTLDKFSAPVGTTFAISANWNVTSALSTSINLKHTQYYSDPPATVLFGYTPATPPDVTLGAADNNYTISINYSSTYDSGIPGLTDQVYGARIKTSGTTVSNWYMKKTMERFQTGTPMLGFDAAVLDLPNIPSDLEPPSISNASSIIASIYLTNRSSEDELRFQYCNHEASPDDDLMARLRLNYDF